MSARSSHDRAVELRVQRALVGLDAAQAAELAELAGERAESPDGWELAAAALHLALARSPDPLPDDLRRQLERVSLTAFGTTPE